MRSFYIVTNRQKEGASETEQEIRAYLSQRGAACAACSLNQSGESYTDPDHVPEDTDCVITIGGDGTLIQAARDLAGRGIPFIGVNRGHLGYLTQVNSGQELSSMLRRYEEEAGEEASLSGFLEEVSLFTDIDNYDQGADCAVMMTVHSAKGLEFPVVFLPGWEEGVFPGTGVLYDPEQVEEERRLAYVAITRAREELTILHAESRMIFGTTSRNRLSRFAGEIPPELLEQSQSRPWSRPAPGMGARPGAASSRPATARAQAVYKPHPVKPAPAGTYRVGDKVSHKTFGAGMILSATPMANDTLLEIAFEKVGTKKLFANFARLEKL